MGRGHGTLGLLDLQRTFADLAGAGSEVSRRSYLEVRLGLALTGWTASGSNWTRTVTAAELTKIGVIRPIVAASSMIHPRELVRVEQVSDLIAGTWYYDDVALVTGGSTTLYVRLPTATDPDDSTAGLVVQLLFCYGGGDIQGNAEVHPLLGANKYLNSGFETWGGGNPTSWTEYGAGAVQETTVVLDGLSSAKIGSAAIGAGALDGVGQSRTGIQGAQYCVSFYYQTPLTGQAPEVEVRLRVGDGTNWLTSDGQTTTTVDGGFRLADTNGEKRRAVFYFIWTGGSIATLQADVLLKNTSGSAKAGLLYVDRMQFRRIWRWNVYEPNLSASSVPELSIQSQSILFGAKTIGFGSATLLDGDGEIAKAMASLLVLQKPATVYVGGSWRNGDEVHRDDWRAQFSALIRKPEVSPGLISLELEDSKALTLAVVAAERHRVADQVTMSRAHENLRKPLVFGRPMDTGDVESQHIIPGIRIELTANDYGKYLYLDDAPIIAMGTFADLPDGWSVKVFPNEDLANRNLQGYEVVTAITSSSIANPTVITTPVPHGLVTGDPIIISNHVGSTPVINGTNTPTVTSATTFTIPVNVTVGGTGGKFVNLNDYFPNSPELSRWEVLRDIRNYRYDLAGNDIGTNATFPFGIAGPAGAVLYANVDISGPAYRAASMVAAAMNTAAGVSNITITHDESTHHTTVARGSGTLDLFMTSTRTDRAHVQSWTKIFGFDGKADKTGSLSYVSDEPTFADVDVDHVLRFNGGGYVDDVDGSICGEPFLGIDNWPAIVSWLLQKRLNQPAATIDLPSFMDARERTRDFDFALVFGSFTDDQIEELFAIAERVAISNIVQDGEGVWHCIRHKAGTAGARVFTDDDYIAGSFRMWLDPTAIYKGVMVHGDHNPSTGRFMASANPSAGLDPYVPIKYGEERTFEIESYIQRPYIVGGTQQVGNHYSRLINAVPRVISFEATSKLVDQLPGYKIIVNKTGPGVLDPTGALVNVAFRIAGLGHRYSTTGISRCVAVEDVQFLT